MPTASEPRKGVRGEQAFEILVPPDGASIPLVAHLPHGGVRVPAAVRRGLLVDDERLEAELLALTDWHTPRLFAPPVVGAGGVAIVNRVSRLVVDPERLPNAREPLAPLGLGAVYIRTSSGEPLRDPRDAVERVALLDGYLHPWVQAVEGLVAEALDRHGRCLILDGHSYPSRPLPYEDPTRPRPEVCLGFEVPHEPAELVAALTASCRAAGFTVAHNTPFTGSYVPLAWYGSDRRVRSVMVELRRDTYLDEAAGEPGDTFADLAGLVEELVGLAADDA